jgi:thiol:disulfide interchange protein/DsbC/DsbD-like thiol-disulfide interchange protein
MPNLIFSLIFSLLSLISFGAQSDESVPAKPVQLNVQILERNNKLFLAVNYENYPEWHTYWKNPGDAGLALKNQFNIKGKSISLNEEEWPAPKRFIENGTQWAYGYIGSYTLFYSLDNKALQKINNQTIELNSTWLVCKNICVPGQKKLSFKISNKKISTQESDLLSPLSNLEMVSRFMNLPEAATIPDYFNFKLHKGVGEKKLVLTYELNRNTDVEFIKNANLIYPFPSAPFDMGHENLAIKENKLEGNVEINWDGEYQTPPVDLPKNGNFLKPYTIKFLFNDPVQRKVISIEKKFESFDMTQKAVNIAPLIDNNIASSGEKKTEISNVKQPENSLYYYLALAFIGGLILNVMPCVLPVISLKLFGMIKYRNESKKKIIRHNFFYTLGILTTFVALALVILVMKKLGSQVGWGFQLQSPHFISVMIVVLFIMALNLFGLFEFYTPGGKHLGNIRTTEDFIGDFFSGVLATILSTPCSAPFLGTALTFAFSSQNSTIFLVFISIGLGLASPFILTAFFPALVHFIPKPGHWMNHIKKFLGLTLILTILWLFDVYNALVDGSSHLIKLATVLVFVFSGFSLIKKDKWFGTILFLASLLLYINLSSTSVISANEAVSSLIRDKQASSGLSWEPWSYDLMNEYKTNKQVVFIDFTAKWCFTCKVNEKLVLETPEFKNFVSENQIKLLIGDWTKKDEVIAGFLKQNGLVGVPAYFIQKSDGTLINLGETISIDKIKKSL